MHGERHAPHPSLLVDTVFDDTPLRRACVRGDLVRLVAGRYVRAVHWVLFDDREKYLMLCFAARSRLHGEVVLSHASAAAVWGFPRLGRWPEKVHVVDPRLEHAETSRYVSRHLGRLEPEEVAVVHGLLVTSPTRTAVDLALTVPFRQAVVALDHGLRLGLFTKGDLRRTLSRRPNAYGVAKAGRAIDFADERADKPGESLSRVVMQEGCLEEPVLQRPFAGPLGEDAYVDFFFASVGAVGEFDGLTKYRDSDRWSGLPPQEVVIREKRREDWIRCDPAVNAFVRWTWADVMAPGRLVGLLVAAGVPCASSHSAAAHLRAV